MSGLQKKLSLGFGVLLLIVIIIGSQSIVELTKLGDSIDVILRENYNSVVACQKMKESLERIDSGILFVLLGDRMRGKELIEKNFTLFEDALKVELNNITLPGEGKKAIDIKKLYEQYKALVDKVILPGAPISFQKKTYFQELFPIFQVIKDKADEVLQMNQRNMNEANEAARLKAAFSRKVMYVLLLAGIMVASAFFLLTTRWILRPINRLIKSAEEIGRGNLDLVIDSSSRDEIGRLSEAFNSMAAGLREFRRSDHARLFYIEHLTQRVFDRLPEAVVVLDADGNVEIATEIARNIFGLKVNANLRDLKLPLASNIFQRAAASGFKTVPEGKETVIQQFLNGEEKFFQPEATPIFNEERQFTGAVLLLKDVTDSLQQNEMKKGIVSTVSHQLKTPLTSIRMAIHVLLEEKVGPLSEKQVELLLAAQEDSDRLYNILSNLLDISRIESGGAGMSFRKEDANELALDAVDSFAFAAHDKGVSIRAELPGDLPEVWADATQISHVFSNILSNALRYTDPGGEIIISAAVDEHKITFNITDTGKGIPPEHLDTIFEQFFRVPDQDAQSGSGLGLAIVKQIVEAHGGKVSASSVEGKGSTFAFTLSRADRIKKEEITQ